MAWIWIGFIFFVLVLLSLDLGVFHRRAHVVSIREALIWSAVWIGLALLFSVVVYFGYDRHLLGLGVSPDAVDGRINGGASATLKYLTGYVVEKSLSVDNIFVIAIVFQFFRVPQIYQHRVLFWGILGALVMRGAMIAVGSVLIARFEWILYVFGAFLIVTAVRMFFLNHEDDSSAPGNNPLVRIVRKFFPVTSDFHGQHFFVRAGSEASHEPAIPAYADQPEAGVQHADGAVDATAGGRIMLTPLALALVVVETTDLIFAVDSIPAIFAVTADPFLVFTSNVFAILGLRSLYFALAGMIQTFRYLKPALSIVLGTVGVKMLTQHWFESWLGESFNLYLLGFVLLVLIGGIVGSRWADRRDAQKAATA